MYYKTILNKLSQINSFIESIKYIQELCGFLSPIIMGIGGKLYMDYNTIGVLLLVFGTYTLIWSFKSSLKNLEKKLQIKLDEKVDISNKIECKQEFISLKEAIKNFGAETKCYFYNGLDKVYEQEKITQEQCYKSMIIGEIKEEKLILYGYKKFSTTKELEQIPINCISDKTIRSPEYDNIYSDLDEILYTNLFVRIDNLNQIIHNTKLV